MLKVYKCHVSLLLLLVLACKSGPLFAGDFHIVAEMSNQAINCTTKYDWELIFSHAATNDCENQLA